MKRLFLIPFLLLFGSPVIAETKSDIRLLCIRNQRAYDVSYIASEKSINYTRKVWLDAYQKEEKKFEDRGEKLRSWSRVEEPFLSIDREYERLSDISREKRHAYARTLLPILELAGYERPEFYLWYYTSYHDEIRARHNIIDLNKVEEYEVGQDYFSHTGSGNDTRDKLCKLYGYEFNSRYSDQKFKKKYGL
tara:strand:+ start:465 stop:1040 length:576 start_codon:yes stop_codon:yes gene_type:complete